MPALGLEQTGHLVPPALPAGDVHTLRVPAVLHFGYGASDLLPDVLRERGLRRPLVLSDSGVIRAGIAERVLDRLSAGAIDADLWAEIQPDPSRLLVEACRSRLDQGRYDCLVAVGGGSVIDVAKAASVLSARGGSLTDCYGLNRAPEWGVPVIAVPTTAGSGSEVSGHAVIVEPLTGKKEAVSGPGMVPSAVLVDPGLTVTVGMPYGVYCAADGLIHAIEAFVARRATALTHLYTHTAVRLIVSSLPAVVSDGRDVTARHGLSLGCLYAGIGMANANAGVIHALGYPLTTELGIPHGLANALMAAAALESTWRGAPERYDQLAGIWPVTDGGPDVTAATLGEAMRRFLASVGIPVGLRAHGVPGDDAGRLAALAVQYRPVLENTPVRVDEDQLRTMYEAAW